MKIRHSAPAGVIGVIDLCGAGQLLGNLLCRIAHLLDSGGSLTQISALLNRVLSLL